MKNRKSSLSPPRVIRPEQLSDQVASHILEAIDQGDFLPGDRLPSEAKLAMDFGVSRTVIREALARLKYDGILESRQGQGVRISAESDRRSFRLGEFFHATNNEASHLFELRAVLEGDAAFLAASRRTEEHLERMQACLDDLQQTIRANVDGTGPDFTFHHLVATATHNKYFIELMDFLNLRIKEVIHQARSNSSQQPGLPEVVEDEHMAIYRALIHMDPDGARQAMLEHIQKAADRLGLSILGAGARACSASG
ncbi:FadR/GntR family transcriptional regulator [Desulfovermiculus halophilus]|uniref:FadR/GntR family transcriptional regulator n=1 Tax=Desulfovermiculus halophilus TaxID=339722 RepID=UPI000686FB1D|nr:FadR/GntR family transcriptional regulator [Desulfovermiculus halophilus]